MQALYLLPPPHLPLLLFFFLISHRDPFIEHLCVLPFSHHHEDRNRAVPPHVQEPRGVLELGVVVSYGHGREGVYGGKERESYVDRLIDGGKYVVLDGGG